jgi:hypothetical protein
MIRGAETKSVGTALLNGKVKSFGPEDKRGVPAVPVIFLINRTGQASA